MPDITALRPEARARYRREREADARLFAFLRANDLRHAYAFDVLAGAPAHLRGRRGHHRGPAVQRPLSAAHASRRPVARGRPTCSRRASRRSATGSPRCEVARPRATRWASTGSSTTSRPRRTPFRCPARAGPCARAPDAGEAAQRGRRPPGHRLVERPGPDGIGVDRGGPRRRAPAQRRDAHQRPRRAPAGAPGRDGRRRRAAQRVAALAARRASRLRWENGAPRIAPSRTLTVRFEPVSARRIRLVEAGPARALERGGAVPAGSAASRSRARRRPQPSSRRAAGSRTPGSRGRPSCAITRRCGSAPDDPAGYEAFARLTTALRASARSPSSTPRGSRRLGLVTEARAVYAEVARALGPERVHVELWRLRARLAAADGDPLEAARLAAEADAALAPARPVGALMGRVAELVGYDVTRRSRSAPASRSSSRRTGACARPPPGDLMVWVHLRAEDRPDNQGARFGDDFPLPGLLPELGPAPQHVTVRRRVSCPPTRRRGGTGWWPGCGTPRRDGASIAGGAASSRPARPRSRWAGSRWFAPRPERSRPRAVRTPSAILGRMDGRHLRHMGRLARIFWAYRTGAQQGPPAPGPALDRVDEPLQPASAATARTRTWSRKTTASWTSGSSPRSSTRSRTTPTT